MDLFEFPDDYKPEKYLSSEEVQEIGEYLEGHPLFMKELPKDIEGNECLQALIGINNDEDPNQTAENLNVLVSQLEKLANKKLKENPNGVPHMKQAYQKYTQGINLQCSSPVINAKLHANRAQLNLQLKNYWKVVTDCKACLKFDPEYTKGYYRYAKALIALQKYDECIKLLHARKEQELTELVLQATAKADKQRLQLQARKTQKQQKLNEVKKYCEDRGWKYLPRKQPLPEGTKVQLKGGRLSIPLMVFYPQFGQFDLVASSDEDNSLHQSLSEIINQGIPWDSNHQYAMENIELFCEVSEAVLMKIPKQANIGDVLKKVPFREALEVQVVRKDNVFYSAYIPQHKII